MIKADVRNWKKEVVGSVHLSPEWFEQPFNMYLINEVVRMQRAARRHGTHKAKTRGEVSGGGKKPFRQKGTGNARQGSIRSPLNVAGGKTFGPRVRKYHYSLPARVRKMGVKQALSYLWKQKQITVVENMVSPDGKTKAVSGCLKTLGLKSALLVDVTGDTLFKRAVRNLPSFRFLPVQALNVYDVLKYSAMVISKESILFLGGKRGEFVSPQKKKHQPEKTATDKEKKAEEKSPYVSSQKREHKPGKTVTENTKREKQ